MCKYFENYEQICVRELNKIPLCRNGVMPSGEYQIKFQIE